MQNFKIENLTYFYPDSFLPALENINLRIRRGEMILLVGHSGCGKSTLLKLLAGLVPAFYGGRISGSAFVGDLNMLKNLKSLAPKVGMLFQDPEKQLVCSTVEREILLPMENMGINKDEAKGKMAEVIRTVGIQRLTDKKINMLSSGQKQKVALASVLGMNPDVLLLDEPTSQIDPKSSEELMNTIKKVAKRSNKTIIMAEQKLEKCLHFADRVIAMDGGRIVFDGAADEYCGWADKTGFEFVPVIPKLFFGFNLEKIPITVEEGHKVLAGLSETEINHLQALSLKYLKSGTEVHRETAVKISKLNFSYDNFKNALKDINLEVKKGEFIAILGQNGAGKTTLLKNINGLLMPDSGTIEAAGVSNEGKSVYELAQRISYLGQNPDDYLFNDTVKDEVLFTLKNFNRKWNDETNGLMEVLGLDKFKDKNPRDLSSGQKQRVALASIMCMFQGIILLDEPTRGMDYKNKKALGEMLLDLQKRGAAIILVTHDVDFSVQYCERVVIMHEGEIAADGTREEILNNNLYFPSQVNKLFKGMGEGRIRRVQSLKRKLYSPLF
ncbi:MAG: ABC transporter ATP-binding protein [Deltaproteobacteria bacterium]